MQTSLQRYTQLSYDLSWRLTRSYSTSFSMGIRLFDRSLRPHIAAIYAMVRVADEIVDSWEHLDQRRELDAFEAATYNAMDAGFSTNPILQAFGVTATTYGIERAHVEAFFTSMRMDLTKTAYTAAEYKTYIYGSAEVVGLMCLHVFCDGRPQLYAKLLPGARALGSAFQKVNFLRDIGVDANGLGRIYFPEVNAATLTLEQKRNIEADITKEFLEAEAAIAKLPKSSRRGVGLALAYYVDLLRAIQKTSPEQLAHKRIRVSTPRKFWLLLLSVRAYI